MSCCGGGSNNNNNKDGGLIVDKGPDTGNSRDKLEKGVKLVLLGEVHFIYF